MAYFKTITGSRGLRWARGNSPLSKEAKAVFTAASSIGGDALMTLFNFLLDECTFEERSQVVAKVVPPPGATGGAGAHDPPGS